LFGKFSPDGRQIAFTGQYGGDEQVYVMAFRRRRTAAAHVLSVAGSVGRSLGLRQSGLRLDVRRRGRAVPSVARCLLARGLEVVHGALRRRRRDRAADAGIGRGTFLARREEIVYSPLWRDFRSEKRYQGGWANDLFIFDLEHPSLIQVTKDPRTDRDPCG